MRAMHRAKGKGTTRIDKSRLFVLVQSRDLIARKQRAILSYNLYLFRHRVDKARIKPDIYERRSLGWQWQQSESVTRIITRERQAVNRVCLAHLAAKT